MPECSWVSENGSGSGGVAIATPREHGPFVTTQVKSGVVRKYVSPIYQSCRDKIRSMIIVNA